MKYSTKLADAVHILLLIHALPDRQLSSAVIAKSIQTNPSYVRQLMASLRNAGLINSRQGSATPSIAFPLEEISLLDLYRAMEGDKPLLHIDAHTNPACHMGMNIQQALGEHYNEIQRQAEKAMQGISLAEVFRTYSRNVSDPAAL